MNNQNLLKKISPDGFVGEVYEIFKEESMLILPKLFQKLEEGILQKSLYESSIILVQKQTMLLKQ
jgi:hypothetical protein